MKRLFPTLLALTACAHAASPAPAGAPPSPPDPPDLLPAIRADVEALLAAQAEAFWKTWTNGGTPDVSGAYRGRDRLLAPEALGQVKKALERASGDERRALGYLRTFLVGELLARESAKAADGAAAAEAAARFAWDGKEVPARQRIRLLAAEPNAERRAGLERAYAGASSKWAPLVAAEDRAVREAAGKLGYPDASALAAELRGRPVQELGALAEELLDSTDAVYRAVMDDLAHRELHVPLGSSRMHDLPRLFHTAHEPRAFPAAELVPDALATFEELGVGIKQIRGLVLDVEARPGKNPRPIVLPVEVPGSVRVSVTPQGGASEARAFLHELGAAAYYAQVTTRTMEFRRLGPAAIPETWALLFEGLAGDPGWLAERAGLSGEGLTREVRAAVAEELHQARLAAARLLCELERSRDPTHVAAAQRRLLARALSRPVDAEEAARWPLDPDPLLHSAESLRARLLSAQAEAFLAKRSGSPAWWRSRDNGKWLSRTWADGSRSSPEELSAALGEPAMGAAVFAARAKARAAAGGIAQ